MKTREENQRKEKKAIKCREIPRAWTDRGLESETVRLIVPDGCQWQTKRYDYSLQVPFPFTTTIIPTLESMTVRFIKHANSFGPRSAGSAYGFVSCFFFWYFLKCDWMATAAFSVSGASRSMSKSSGGTSFLDASVDSCVFIVIHGCIVILSIKQTTNNLPTINFMIVKITAPRLWSFIPFISCYSTPYRVRFLT